ncbi:MAG: winged helix-turn-helix transcriptional regulator [Candidatus Bathyarchaeia archaeon]|jgi:DNA-binding Lrp family transcriptional regulator
MKEVELKLLQELMKNSRRSDRDLAKAVGVSQPTISRTIKKLEEQGVIKEFTIIPDFGKLGFELMAVIMYKLRAISPEELDELHRAARELDKEERRPYLLVMEGSGMGKNLVVVSFHKTYSDYASYMRIMKEAASSGMKAYMNMDDVEGFLIDLNFKKHYQPITFSKMAAHLQKMTRSE